MAYKNSFSLAYFSLSFLLLCHGSSVCSDLIHDTCKDAANSDPNLSYDFCIASLESDPKSQNATLRELGVISIKLTISNATHVRSYIKKLLRDTKYDPFAKSCLRDCSDLYSDAIPALRSVVRHFKSEDCDKANIEVSSAMDASTTCEDGFGEKEGEVSPLTKENNIFFQLTAIALAFTKTC